MALRFIWRFFLIGLFFVLIYGVLIYGLIVVASITFFGLLQASGLDFLLLCLIPIILLAIPVILILGRWLTLADVVLVIENAGIGDAISRSWTLVKEKLGAILLISLISWILSIGLAVVYFAGTFFSMGAFSQFMNSSATLPSDLTEPTALTTVVELV